MMFKIYFSILMISCFSLNAISQEDVLPIQDSNNLRKNIVEKSKKTTSIRSDFIQKKHLDFLLNDIESSGVLSFRSPDLIKWEYQKPFNYLVIFKENKIYINDDGTKNKIDLSANRIFESLNDLLIRSVTGDMFDDNKFKISYFHNQKNYIVKFKPFSDPLKSFINEIVISFDKKSLHVVELRMIESSEDYTLLTFLNQKFNETITDENFNY